MEEDDVKDCDATKPGKKRARTALEQSAGNTTALPPASTLPAPAPALAPSLAPPPSHPPPSQSQPPYPTSSSSISSPFNRQLTTAGTAEPSLIGASDTPVISRKTSRQTRKRFAPRDTASPTTATATKRVKTTSVANTTKTAARKKTGAAAKKGGTTAGRFAVHPDEVDAPYELEYPETSGVERGGNGDGYNTHHNPSTHSTHPQTQILNHCNGHSHNGSFANGNGNMDNNHHHHHHGGYGYGYQGSSIPPLYPQFQQLPQQLAQQPNLILPNLNSGDVDPNTTTPYSALNNLSFVSSSSSDGDGESKMGFTRMLMGRFALGDDDDGGDDDERDGGHGQREEERHGHGHREDWKGDWKGANGEVEIEQLGDELVEKLRVEFGGDERARERGSGWG
ncbi:hypothetical protein EX30DRAFT_342473 [Ascodesmis nigricans]|uniref:Uncharacterized protein n=1 Tax=Ascodesmis nigricans TaxID=341454 RepID=A0A4S2MQM6_9PEZI|nr:hypothetical protein EX30DRAFT_342473 [Ascodesmis nigricans]